MDDARVGTPFRSLRLRRRWRQADLAARSEVSQSAISDIELGRIGGMSIDCLRRVAKALDMRIEVIARSRGGELDRLLNARHATLASAVAAYLQRLGWEVAPEVSFAVYGERGWVDILAWHAPTRPLLVVEVKTELVDVHDTLGVLDRKTRLAPQLAGSRGWRPAVTASWLVLAEGKHQSASRQDVQAAAAGGTAIGRSCDQCVAARTCWANPRFDVLFEYRWWRC